jgi:N-carbamoyl-L-amino-acid hydrolase
MAGSFEQMWLELAAIGRDADTGGYRRPGWSPAVRECEEWFLHQAAARNLTVETDAVGNRLAWWSTDASAVPSGVVTGSHLDSVPDGGAYDGPLGVVSGLAAIDRLRADGYVPSRPLGVAVFAEEEGSRFGQACLGSRLATGALNPARAVALTDCDGTTLRRVYEAAGVDVDVLLAPGAEVSSLPGRMTTFVELHVEQGRGLVDSGVPVGVATAIWPHGRWRVDLTGRADHAGATRMEDRRDPMLTYAMLALAANKQARLLRARATLGRVEVTPNATNAIPSRVCAWLDARAADQETLDELLDVLTRQAFERAGRDGTGAQITAESMTPLVTFDDTLRDRLAAVAGDVVSDGAPVPALPSGAGHDAGVLAAAGVPSAMLFVRNPTGVSHSPDEHAETGDCLAGVEVLAAVLADLTSGDAPTPR